MAVLSSSVVEVTTVDAILLPGLAAVFAFFAGLSGDAGAGAAFFLPPFLPDTAATNSASVQTSTPLALAASILVPAPSPATRMSVLAVTLEPTVAPAVSACSLASARLISSVPVKQSTLPCSDMCACCS